MLAQPWNRVGTVRTAVPARTPRGHGRDCGADSDGAESDGAESDGADSDGADSDGLRFVFPSHPLIVRATPRRIRDSLRRRPCRRSGGRFPRLPPPLPRGALPPWSAPSFALCACRLGGTASEVCQPSEQGGEAEGGRQGSMRRRLKTLASRWRCEDASSSATRHSAEFDTSTSALFSGVSGGGRLWPFVVIRRASQYHTSFVCQISIAIT